MHLRSLLKYVVPCSVLSLGVGCSGADAGSSETDEADLTKPAALTLHLKVSESKEVYTSRAESFTVTDAKSLDLPCRERWFSLTSKDSLYGGGWSEENAAAFSEYAEGARYKVYSLAQCRDAEREIFALFGEDADSGMSVSEQLLDEGYKPTEQPLLLRLSSIGTDKAAYYSCNSAFKKTLIDETASAKRYDISVACKPRGAPAKGDVGPLDFVANPGPYAAIASYYAWLLPSVPSTKPSFERVRDALLAKVPKGTYTGAMRKLTNACGLEIRATDDGLVLEHTIVSSDRARRLELKASDLLGFVEGDVYKDPIHVKGDPKGTFAAAEFRDAKGESLVVRFEQNDDADDKMVRINGSEAYCRRLVKK